MSVLNRASAQSISSPYTGSYTITDIGSDLTVPAKYGGMTFLNDNTLLVSGNANTSSAGIYTVSVTRDNSGHITGFTGAPSLFSTAPGISGNSGIDAGLTYGPGGVLFYSSYPDNSIGEIKPGSTSPDKQIALSGLGVASSVGSFYIVPNGFAGAGEVKMASVSSGYWYTATLTPDGTGAYNITDVVNPDTPNTSFPIKFGLGPEGIVYIKAGNPGFAVDTMLIAGSSQVYAYQLDANGDPIISSGRDFAEVPTAEGETIDPVTGDLLVNTFGSGNHVYRISGFNSPTNAPEPGALSLIASLSSFALWTVRRRTRFGIYRRLQ